MRALQGIDTSDYEVVSYAGDTADISFGGLQAFVGLTAFDTGAPLVNYFSAS